MKVKTLVGLTQFFFHWHVYTEVCAELGIRPIDVEAAFERYKKYKNQGTKE